MTQFNVECCGFATNYRQRSGTLSRPCMGLIPPNSTPRGSRGRFSRGPLDDFFELLLNYDVCVEGNVMLTAGQVLYDNDPRYRGRRVEFIRIEGSHALCKSGPLQVKIRLDRIFSDGQHRRSGYTTVALSGRANPVGLPALA